MEKITLSNKEFVLCGIYDDSITIPDSFVVDSNKTCKGHGEAKFYMGNKDRMRQFYAGDKSLAGFEAQCFILKEDLLKYMQVMKHEYQYPSIKYRGLKSNKNLLKIWKQRMHKIESLDDMIFFKIKDQDQIVKERGYVKSQGNPRTGGYGIIREISLPFVSYISIMKLFDEASNTYMFYWKLFADFEQMAKAQYAAKHYGLGKKSSSRNVRDKQRIYRIGLYSIFEHCPFTQIDDIKLLIASHIKPWAICNDDEKYDLNNGFMLSPLFDKLFDKGYISFNEKGDIIYSNWLSEENKSRIDFNYTIKDLHLTDERKEYLRYHRDFVLK